MLRMISVYSEDGKPNVWVEGWDGEKRRRKHYQASQASLDRLADIVNVQLLEGRMRVRPFLGGCIGYVARETQDA